MRDPFSAPVKRTLKVLRLLELLHYVIRYVPVTFSFRVMRVSSSNTLLMAGILE